MRDFLIVGALFFASSAFAADVNMGHSNYIARCQSCHGTTGNGDGPAARALPKPPRSFATPEFWVGMTDERLASTITNGKPGSAMRGFPMDDKQREDLIAYLNTLRPAAK